MTIEACVASVASALAAELGGADRLELNVALELDGLTPSIGLFNRVRAVSRLPVIVMIRPRNYGFDYADAEFETMLADIDAFLEAGADGFAVGLLTSTFEIDKIRTRQVVERMGDAACVFHRAFDVTPSMTRALEDLIDCGVKRVLTSGQQSSAITGARQIRQLVEQAAGRIEILPGAGINPENVVELITKTGCTQVHGTFRGPSSISKELSGLDLLRAPAPAGADASVVAAVRQHLDAIQAT